MTGKEQYTDDAPIASHSEDRFSRWPFAERIAHVIAKRTDAASIVLGIYGPWGDGKTSVLNMMGQALEGSDAVVCLKFNPWHFEDEEHLIRAFFDTFADALKTTLKTKGEAIGEFLGKYGAILSLASSNVGAAAKGVGEQLSTVHLDELKRRVSQLLIESGQRVVILIDDIDRLDRSEIHAVLKLVKLSASFSNTAYVLAFDDEVVAASLGERYGGGGAEAGRQFLEKIIQVPLHLPDAEDVDLRSMCFEGVDEVVSENALDLQEDDAEGCRQGDR
jgi:predicted KAP-like P-loop ATPase